MELIELVRHAKAGDAEAQGALYESSYKRVYYLALRLTKNPEDAEDAAQETFVAAFGALPNLQNDNSYEGWLFKIAANKCRNKLSRAKQTDELPEDFAEHTPDPNESFVPEAVLQDAEKRRLILEIINHLPDAQRECVMLFYYGDMSVRQIAEMLDCSEGTVKSRLNYARQKIKDSILETEERDGIRLHTFIPIGLLLAQDYEAVTADLTTAILGGTGITGASAAANGTTATGGVKAGLLASLKGKIIASVAAVAILTGGVTVYHNMLSNTANISNAEQDVSLTEAANSSDAPKDADEDDWFTTPITFADEGMEQNVRLLLGIPAEQSITPEDLQYIYQVGFIGDGMNMFDGENWLGGGYIETATGTVPVLDFSDLQYFAGRDAHMLISIVDPTYSVDLDQIRKVVPHVRFEYHDGRGPQP